MKKILLLLLISLLYSCASDPVIDPQGVDMDQYAEDLAECKTVADQLNSGVTIAKSAAFGAAVRGAIGAIIDPENAGSHIAIGVTEGAATGSLKNDQETSTVIKKCLQNRGYQVLN